MGPRRSVSNRVERESVAKGVKRITSEDQQAKRAKRGQAVTHGPTAFATTVVAGSGPRRSVSKSVNWQSVTKSVKRLSRLWTCGNKLTTLGSGQRQFQTFVCQMQHIEVILFMCS